MPHALFPQCILQSSDPPFCCCLQVLDVDTQALSKTRAYGVADEALSVVAADKPDRLADEERERTSARRTVNQLAKIRGEPPVVEVAAATPAPGTPALTAGTGKLHAGCVGWVCGVGERVWVGEQGEQRGHRAAGEVGACEGIHVKM